MIESLKQERVNFEAQIFKDGEQALQYLQTLSDSHESSLPSLVILDLNLPRVDGTQLLRFIRDSTKLSRLPVVVVSSSPEDIIYDRAPQASGYIEKPPTLDEFLAIGKRILQYWREAAQY